MAGCLDDQPVLERLCGNLVGHVAVTDVQATHQATATFAGRMPFLGHEAGKLLEAILLQAELLDLKANPNRPGEGIVVEAKMEQGRGSVSTVLMQRGTLKVGDIFVTGSEWGRVRAMISASGEQINEAGPSVPVEVLGLNGTPDAGDDVIAVENEARAREICEFRERRKREASSAVTGRGTLEQMFEKIKDGEIVATTKKPAEVAPTA